MNEGLRAFKKKEKIKVDVMEGVQNDWRPCLMKWRSLV